MSQVKKEIMTLFVVNLAIWAGVLVLAVKWSIFMLVLAIPAAVFSILSLLAFMESNDIRRWRGTEDQQ